MTDSNLTHVLAILDKSGSMYNVVEDTEGGFNAFIKDQAKIDGKCQVSLYKFDNSVKEVYWNRDVHEVPALKLNPEGGTALFDAIGEAVVKKGKELSELPESERPGAVIVMILSDGAENASRTWHNWQIKTLITQQTDAFGWKFIFMGSNQDAVLAASDIGIARHSALTYTGASTLNAFTTVANTSLNYRGAIAAGAAPQAASLSSAFSDEERAEAVK